MEKKLTAAGKMRRRFKAGRPGAIRNDLLTPLQAIHRITTEAKKAQDLMRDEGLDPKDVQCALIYVTPELPGFENVARYRGLPASDEGVQQYFSEFAKMTGKSIPLFLGILWYQADHEAKAKGDVWQVSWITPFMAGPKAEEMLLAARDHFVRGGSKSLDN
jgi:hypothetical protein